MLGFTERAKKKEVPKDSEDLKKDNAPSEGREDLSYALTISKIDAVTYNVQVNSLGISMQMKADQQDSIQFTSMTFNGEKSDLKTLHWSQMPDKSLISVLVGTETNENKKTIAAFYFRSNLIEKKKPSLLDRLYRYHAGPGVGIGWDSAKPLKLEICGARVEENFARDSFNQWAVALKGRLDVELKRATVFAPFSDLNQQCIYAVDIYENEPESFNYGIAGTMTDLRSSRIIDSDLIIFNRAFKRTEDLLRKKKIPDEYTFSYIEKTKSITYTHELGHLLGLAHQFDGTKSVMSYEFDSQLLTDYDIKAIQALYPRK